MLDPESCRQRQKRLLRVMQEQKLDSAFISAPHHVYYFTGHRSFWLHESALVLNSEGRTVLSCGKSPEVAPAVDDVRVYESNWMSTQRQEQAALAAELVVGELSNQRVGFDTSAVAAHLLRSVPQARLLDDAIWQMRRTKDFDEVALMRRAAACTEAMYRRAREIIEPGISEIRVYCELQQIAVQIADEPLSPAYLGNDYACAEPGGPPRANRSAQAGELYILDLGPAYRGYFSDNCRTFSVDRKPTDAQMKAWQIVTDSFPIVERLAKPGVRCRDIFDAVDDHYRARTGKGFPHHLGHGVGLQPHEFPHLNPRWGDALMEGEVFTAEPGLYSPELRAGMRFENQYLVTKSGVENLTPFPLGLV
jgi:Xaa-Pro aminopeptidase